MTALPERSSDEHNHSKVVRLTMMVTRFSSPQEKQETKQDTKDNIEAPTDCERLTANSYLLSEQWRNWMEERLQVLVEQRCRQQEQLLNTDVHMSEDSRYGDAE